MRVWKHLREHASAMQIVFESGVAALVPGVWVSVWFSNGDPVIVIGAAILVDKI
jgi:hypothetical protein